MSEVRQMAILFTSWMVAFQESLLLLAGAMPFQAPERVCTVTEGKFHPATLCSFPRGP